jgi:hypothetical protein
LECGGLTPLFDSRRSLNLDEKRRQAGALQNQLAAGMK